MRLEIAIANQTDNLTNGDFLGRGRLLVCVVDDQVEEDVKTAEGPADFSAALEVDEDAFVHELGQDENAESNGE